MIKGTMNLNMIFVLDKLQEIDPSLVIFGDYARSNLTGYYTEFDTANIITQNANALVTIPILCRQRMFKEVIPERRSISNRSLSPSINLISAKLFDDLGEDDEPSADNSYLTKEELASVALGNQNSKLYMNLFDESAAVPDMAAAIYDFIQGDLAFRIHIIDVPLKDYITKLGEKFHTVTANKLILNNGKVEEIAENALSEANANILSGEYLQGTECDKATILYRMGWKTIDQKYIESLTNKKTMRKVPPTFIEFPTQTHSTFTVNWAIANTAPVGEH